METREDAFANENRSAPDLQPEATDPARRTFLQGALAASAAALGALGAASLAHAQTELKRTTISHYYVPATDKTVH
jgi:hypothetical protein